MEGGNWLLLLNNIDLRHCKTVTQSFGLHDQNIKNYIHTERALILQILPTSSFQTDFRLDSP